MALRLESPLGMGLKRSGSSPPSPVLLRPPRRFMAMARVSCASLLIEPYDMAPVLKRLTMSSMGSTSSMAIGLRDDLKSMRPRKVFRFFDWSLMSGVLLEDVVALAANRVLELGDGLGTEQVVLAIAAVAVLAAGL
jgi:hypothetical protein